MKRSRRAVAVAVALFLVLSGTGVSHAYWSTHATGQASVQAASATDNCHTVATLVNSSFEAPAISEAWYRNVPAADVPGWDTTDPVGIEVWKSGGEGGVTTPAGNQFVELNASQAGTLSQSIATTPGQTLSWSLLHRGRAGVDVMEIRLGAPAAASLQGSLSDGLAWGRHTGTYVVPAGQTTTVISLSAVSTAGGNISVGNFLDDIFVGTGPCLTTATTLANVTSPGTPPRVGDTLEYTTTVSNTGGAPSALTRLSGTLPAGLTYVPGSLRATGTVQTDATGDDSAEYVASSRTFTTRLGVGASATGGGAIAPADSATFTLRSVVNAIGSAQITISYANGAASYADPLAPSWVVSAPLAPVVSTIAAATDLATAQVVTNASQVPGGTNAPRWTITVRNNGPRVANDAMVRVVIPAGLASPAVAVGSTACKAVSGMTLTFDCDPGNVRVGESTSIVVSGTIPASYSGDPSLVVTATVRASIYDHNPANNTSTGTATVTFPVTPTADVGR